MFVIMSFSAVTNDTNNNNYNPMLVDPGRTYYWYVSGKTDAPSSAVCGQTINLQAVVTSYSKSSGNPWGDSRMYFIVYNSQTSECVHSETLGHTGTYNYEWTVNLPGKITFEIKYLSSATSHIIPYKYTEIPGVVYGYSYFGDSNIYKGTCTFNLSGNTIAPQIAVYGSSVNLQANIRSFSESNSAARTEIYFTVSNSTETFNVQCCDIHSKGIYAYVWQDDLKGNVIFEVNYISKQGSNGISYSCLGNSQIDSVGSISALPNEKGYDGNNVIYLASPKGGTSYLEYGYTNLGNAVATFDKNSEDDSSVVNVSYCGGCSGGDFRIIMRVISAGGSNDFYVPAYCGGLDLFYSAAYQRLGLTLEGAPSSAVTDIKTGYNGGFNVTGPDEKGTTVSDAYINMGINTISLVPCIATEAATAVYSYYNNIYALSGVEEYRISNTGSGTVFQNYCIDGGTMAMYSGGRDIFGGVENITIDIPYSDLNNNFKINAFSTNYYECGDILAIDKSANASKTINAVTASAIYGVILGKNNSTDNISHANLYIQNANNGNIYNVSIVHGRYLFFAKPDTEYKIYYDNNGDFKLLTTIPGSDLTAGGSYEYRIPEDKL